VRAIYVILLFVFLLSGCATVAPVSNENATLPRQVVTIPDNATPVQLNKDCRVYISDMSDRWTVSATAPDFLVEERAHKRELNLKKQGKNVDKNQLLEVARKQLQNEELFVYNALSQAYLTVDLVRLKEGGRPPSEKVVRQSTVYGVQSLQSEGGVTDVSSSVNNSHLAGVTHATKFNASYRQFEQPIEFSGIIGFQKPYWLFLYYTDFLKDVDDMPQMEQLMEAIIFEFK